MRPYTLTPPAHQAGTPATHGGHPHTAGTQSAFGTHKHQETHHKQPPPRTPHPPPTTAERESLERGWWLRCSHPLSSSQTPTHDTHHQPRHHHPPTHPASEPARARSRRLLRSPAGPGQKKHTRRWETARPPPHGRQDQTGHRGPVSSGPNSAPTPTPHTRPSRRHGSGGTRVSGRGLFAMFH
jgi:hypothetical protein